MTKRLDEDQIAHLAQLTDSIRSVFAYAQGEIRLWEAAYYAQEQRLDDNAGMIGRNGDAIARLTAADRTVDTRLGQLARVDQSQQGRLDGLESQARTQSTAVAALARRAETQEASVRGVASSVADLRATLATLDSELDGVEDELAESGTAYAQMGTRVDRVSGWMDGFRRAGLSAEAVDNRLSALTDELRRVRIRVDSLRRSGAAAGASERLR
jgi:chromosome segregation ATPase